MRNYDYREKWKKLLTPEIISLLTSIHEYKGEQRLIAERYADVLTDLVDIARIQSTESSNKIEGIVTTESRIKQLIADKTTPKNRDEKEIMGYRDVLNIIHENFEYIPLTSNYILQLHKYLYQYASPDFGGNFKNVQNYIIANLPDGSSKTLFTPLSPIETPLIKSSSRKLLEYSVLAPKYNLGRYSERAPVTDDFATSF